MPETILLVCILVALMVAYECGRISGRREAQPDHEITKGGRREYSRQTDDRVPPPTLVLR